MILFCCACGTIKQVPVNHYIKDTVSIHMTDTLILVNNVEKLVQYCPPDSISVIETSQAKSEARLESGHLKHSLENKPVEVQTKVVYRDRVRTEYQDKIVEVEKEVIKIPDFFYYSIGINILLLFLLIIKFLKKINII